MRLQIGIDGKTYEVEVEVLQDDAAPRGPVHGAYSAMPSTIHSPALQNVAPPAASADENVDEAKVCRSPVAGIVIRVNIQPGQKLQAHDLMLVLEAMKMETNVTAPGAGTVKTIRVKPQESVKVNQVLVELE
ncbi:MAG TPA: biotin/lipoyl-containing protein [Candidatus Binataceae bacterium]|nr:biotin/lipoyl-containing protein [Candidatus Binataceae bacterium]